MDPTNKSREKNECDQSVTQEQTLHMRSIHIKCIVCGTLFVKQNYLINKYLRTRIQVSNNMDVQCWKKFALKDNLNCHMKIHTDE